MSWKEIDNITLLEAFDKAKKGHGVLIFRKVLRQPSDSPMDEFVRPTRPIEFYLWEDE